MAEPATLHPFRPRQAPAAEPAGAPPIALGPAEVVAAGASSIAVRLEDGSVVDAQLALGHRYEAEVGDTVLVVGSAGRHWVIGVILGRGTTRLAFQGDVDVAAVGGVLRLSGDAVEIDAPEMKMRIGRKLSVVADAVVEHLGVLHRHVTGLLQERAGRSHSVVDGSSYQQAREVTVLASEQVTVNGRKVHLG